MRSFRSPNSALLAALVSVGVVLLTGATAPASDPERLRAVLHEYQRVQLNVRGKEEYRAWIDRINRAIAADPSAAPDDVYIARRMQVPLANGLEAWDESLHYANEAARLAPTPAEAFDAGFSAASIALRACKSFQSEQAERVLRRFTALQEQVEGPGGLLARSPKEIESWGRTYLLVLIDRAWLLTQRGAHEEALGLYEKTLRLLSEDRIPPQSISEIKKEQVLLDAMRCAARCKDKARSERYLLLLSELPDRTSSMSDYVEQLAMAEGEPDSDAFRARLSWWVNRVGPDDPSWPETLLRLARSQTTRLETRPEAVRNLERLLSAYEKRTPPKGVNWPHLRNECWLQLASLHVDCHRGMSRAREFAQKYLDATRDDESEYVKERRAEMQQLIEVAQRADAR